MIDPILIEYAGLNGVGIRNLLTTERDPSVLRLLADDSRGIVSDKAKSRLKKLGLELAPPTPVLDDKPSAQRRRTTRRKNLPPRVEEEPSSESAGVPAGSASDEPTTGATTETETVPVVAGDKAKPSGFVIKWLDHYVSRSDLGSARPYTQDITQAKTWRTRANADRYLRLKDDTWASKCTIEPVPSGDEQVVDEVSPGVTTRNGDADSVDRPSGEHAAGPAQESPSPEVVAPTPEAPARAPNRPRMEASEEFIAKYDGEEKRCPGPCGEVKDIVTGFGPRRIRKTSDRQVPQPWCRSCRSRKKK